MYIIIIFHLAVHYVCHVMLVQRFDAQARRLIFFSHDYYDYKFGLGALKNHSMIIIVTSLG